MKHKAKWECLVTESDLKIKIESKINEITQVIISTSDSTNKLGLLDGNCGFAIYLSHLDKYNNNKIHLDFTEELLYNSIKSINNGFNYFPFSNGISGIIWSIFHLQNEKFIESESHYGDLANIVNKEMLAYGDSNNFDYLHGASGMLLYLLSDNSFKNELYIDPFLMRLKKNGVTENDTIKWETSINTKLNLNAYGISLSHGISSTIIILSKILDKTPEHLQAYDLLEKSANYLISQKNDLTKGIISLYPSYASSSSPSLESRLGWCYGDLGVAVALYKAGSVLNNEILMNEAIEIMFHASKRKNLSENFVIDAGFCHGTIGISHIFNRFYQQTKIETFRETAIYWIEQTLSMSQFEDGFAGYKSHTSSGWENNKSLLEGITGIGLSLLSTISEVEPKWDAALLLS